MRPAYRVRQFLGALFPRNVDTACFDAGMLTPAEAQLFEREPAAVRKHSLAVFAALRAAGHTEPVLLRAALLHDVGKADGRVALWHRVALVLLQAVSPVLLLRLAVNEPRSWRYPFYVQLHHGPRGADMLAAIGSEAALVTLVRTHHAPAPASMDEVLVQMLAALKQADERY